MSFLAPGRLWLLLVPVALAVAYVVLQRMRRRYAVRFTNLELLASVAPRRPGWRRHLTTGVLLGAITLLAVGFARPVREVRIPKEQATIVLALDVSTSMSADDVAPNRLVAAQRAATEFAESLPAPLRLGLVSFAATAAVDVAPTTDRAAVTDAIARLTLRQSTAIGEAIYAALATIPPADDSGTPVPAHVVLMSDGTTTSGRPNADAVAAAVAAGVPVTTIAYGTDSGSITIGGQTVGVPVDRDSLRTIATATGGRFFEAADADELRGVYDDIGRVIGYETETREITDTLVGLALLAATASAVGSLLWTGRLP